MNTDYTPLKKVRDFNKICKVVDSCISHEQLEVAKNLIEAYCKFHKSSIFYMTLDLNYKTKKRKLDATN